MYPSSTWAEKRIFLLVFVNPTWFLRSKEKLWFYFWFLLLRKQCQQPLSHVWDEKSNWTFFWIGLFQNSYKRYHQSSQISQFFWGVGAKEGICPLSDWRLSLHSFSTSDYYYDKVSRRTECPICIGYVFDVGNEKTYSRGITPGWVVLWRPDQRSWASPTIGMELLN